MSLNQQPLLGNSFTPIQRVSLNSALTNLILDSDPNNSSFVVRTGSNTSFYVDKYSNVGINTANPTSQLEVASATGSCLRLRYGSSASAYANLFTTNTGDLAINTASAGSSITTTSSLNISNHDGASIGLKLGGTIVAATAQQLGYSAVAIAGVAEASRALVTNAGRDIGNIHKLTASQLSGEIQTALQPKITSLGTLTSLAVNGDVAFAGNFTINGNSIGTSLAYLTETTAGVATANKALVTNSTRDLTNLNNVGAVTVSLGSNMLSTTEAGYLTGITAGTAAVGKALVVNSDGDINSIHKLSAVQLTGQIQTAAQPNITSLGTLTSLSLGNAALTQTEGEYLTSITPGSASNSKALVTSALGDISGIRNLSAVQLTGQLQTSYQPTINSIGTLTSLTVSGSVTVSATTEASSSSSGALTISGGLAVAKSAFLGNDLTVGGNLYVNGTSSVVNSTAVSIQDNTLVLNASPIGVNDSGLMITRFQTANDTGAGSVITDTPNVVSSVSSASLTTLVLSSGSSPDNYYQGWWLKVGSQTRKVQSFTGSSKTITVDTAFTTTPTTGASVSLYNRTFASFIWNEGSRRFYAAYTAKDASSTLTIIDDASLRALDIQSTGQLTATASTDSTTTTTGAVVITGGVGIGKSLYVGTGMYGTIQTASQPGITSVNTLDISGHTGYAGLKLGGTLVTTSAVQLNYLTGVTPGASGALKAIVTDAANAIQLSALRIGSSVGDTAMSYLTNSATDAVFKIGMDLSTNNSMSLLWSANGHYLGFTTSGASSPQLVVSSSGNVGIGTATPAYRLSFGASMMDRVLAITEVNSDFYGFGSVTATSALAYQSKSQHEFYTSSTSTTKGTLIATITPTGIVANQLTGQLQTASQPHITSIGTLSTLTVGSSTVTGPLLGYLVGSSEGVVTGSKVIIANSTKDVAGIRKLGLSGAPDLLKLTNTDATGYVETALVSDTYTFKIGINGSTNTVNPSLAYWNYNGADRILMNPSGDVMIGTTTTGGYRVNVSGTINANNYYVNGTLLDTGSISYASEVTPGTAAPNKAIVLDASSNITGINALSTTSITIGSTTLSGTQTAYITGVSPGTAANGKAIILSSSGDIGGINSLSVYSLIVNGVDVSTSISSSAYVTNITAGSAAASKALVLDSNSNISGIGSMSMSSVVLGGTTLTSTEATYLSGVTLGTVSNGKALVASSTGTVSGLASLTMNGQTLTGTHIGYLTGVTPGTASASKALVLDTNLNVTNMNSLQLINTTTAVGGTALTVNAAAAAWGVSVFDTTNNIKTGIATNGRIGTFSNHALLLATNNSTRITIATDGKVGIGLTPATYNLEVNGSFNATSYNVNGTATDLTLLSGTTAGVATNSKALIVGSGGAVSGLSSVSTTTIVVNGSSIGTEAAYLAGATLGTVTASKTIVADATNQVTGFANVGTTKLTLAGTALGATEAGYLSGATVGTAAPGKVVLPNANGDVSGLRVVSLSGTVGDLLTLTNTTSSGYIGQTMTSDTYALSIGVRGSTNGTNPNMAYLYYNNAYRLLINASGEVMVGTATGGYRLNVGGSFNATSYSLNGTALDFSNLGYIVGVAKGTAAAGKALVLDDTGKLNGGIVSLAATTLVVNGSSISTEAAYLAGATAGAVTASKVVVTDASSQITGFAKVGTTILTLGGTDLSVTHAGYLSGATVGAVTASKVIIASSANEISGLSKVTTTTLTVGSTDFTATQAAYLTGITAGQVTASKAVVASSGGDIANIRSIALTNNGVNISLTNTATTARSTVQFVGDTKTFELGSAGSANTSFPNSSFYLYDSTASAVRMVVDPSGNVGIGTTTPTTKLTVAGTINVTTGAVNAPAHQIGGVTYDISLLSATAGTATASKALILNTGKAVDTLNVTGTMTAGILNAPVHQMNGVAYDISLLSATAGTATASKALILDSSKGVAGIASLGTRNIIIGSDQTATSWLTSGIQYQSASATYTNSTSGTAASAVFTSFAQPTLAASNTGTVTTTASTMYIAGPPVAGTNMTITNPYSLWVPTGNVLIGGSSHAGGDMIQLQTGSTVTRNTIKFINDAQSWELGSRGSSSAPSSAFYLFDNTVTGGKYRLTVLPTTGNIGINTYAPAYQLDVSGSIRATGSIYAATNIGVGTTTPSVALDVVGSIKASGDVNISGALGIGTSIKHMYLDAFNMTGASNDSNGQQAEFTVTHNKNISDTSKCFISLSLLDSNNFSDRFTFKISNISTNSFSFKPYRVEGSAWGTTFSVKWLMIEYA
jgi:hypothetical protein